MSGPAASLAISINASEVIIDFGLTNPGWAPSGHGEFAGGEIFQYDGLHNTGAGGSWRANVLKRGALGSSPALHTAGEAVTEIIPQVITPDKGILIEGDDGSGWERISPAVYEPQAESGRFDFTYDVAAEFTSGLRASYAVFDEGSGSAVTLSDLVIKQLEEARSAGGPEYSASGYDVDGSAIKLSREMVERSIHTLPYLRDLADRVGLITGEAEDPFFIAFQPASGKVQFKQISQAVKSAVPDEYYFRNAIRSSGSWSLERQASAILIEYESGVNFNLLSSERFLHPEVSNASETLGAEGLEVQSIDYMEGPDLELMAGYSADTTTGNGNLHTKYLVDGRSDTAWRITADPDTGASPVQRSPGAGADFLFGWFNAAGDSFALKYGKFVLDARRISAGENMSSAGERDPYNMQILGMSGYTVNTLTPGTIVNLGANFEYDIPNTGSNNLNTDDQSEIILEGEIGGRIANGLLFRSDGFSGNRSGSLRWNAIKQAFLRGSKTKTVLIELTNSTAAAQDSTKYYDEEAYSRLIDTTHGEPRIPEAIRIGPATRESAISIGRVALQASRLQSRTYEYTYNNFKSIPHRGETVVCDGQVGVVMTTEVVPGLSVDAPELTLIIRDYS